ncbi:Amino acid permease 8 [Apostasia shenzhenica]|uniref:Amino acid permease 8 n=1 Tax=Apostasia shenzhenica TaxID=1088818 RepID=A0A2I0AAG6_9ASPA|nr:Amino acid permease 8 [Apostasia shenzhenica]
MAGTVWTATAHAITAVIGSGVLGLPWSVAQLGWVFGPIGLLGCAYVTYFTALLLTDCYRTPDGKRNHTYMDVAKSYLGFMLLTLHLGPKSVFICGITQYAMLWGSMIGYTVTALISMMAIKRTDCLHYKGPDAECNGSGNWFIFMFGLIEVVMSQFPNLEEITVVSWIAAAMSFAYSLIALYLSTSKLASNHRAQGTILGVKVGEFGVPMSTKIWQSFQAMGNIAFAYTYSMLLIEIQDTLKPVPPENETMRRSSLYGIGITTIFYVSVGCLGYAAFGNNAPGNIITGFQEPFWLIDLANIACIIHLIGAYQVFAQPLFAAYEEFLSKKYSKSPFFHKKYIVPLFSKTRVFQFTLSKIVLRSAFVVLTTIIAMMVPFFNAVVGLLGAIAFWPLTVYFPIAVYMARAHINKGEWRWLALNLLNVVALVVSLLAAAASIINIIEMLKHVVFFKTQL